MEPGRQRPQGGGRQVWERDADRMFVFGIL